MPKFSHIHPRNSLRRLRTAFSPISPSMSMASTSSRSPLSASTSARASSELSGFNFDLDNLSESSLSCHRAPRRHIRSKKSILEVEQEEERHIFANALDALIEPRPQIGASLGGIEEVLEGRI